MLALIDGDLITYRCAAVTEAAAEGIAKWQADQLITRIVEDVNATDWKIFLSGDNNFRYSIYPDYKANRRNMVKPKWLETLREHLVLEWNAVICDGIEADDALGMAQCSKSETQSTVICSIDKDLRQIPGNHYHFVNRTWLDVDFIGGWKWFYTQLLTGDTADNIKGCPGIGPVKAERALKECQTVDELYAAASKAYIDVYKDVWFSELKKNAQLLYIWRKENDCWQSPVGEALGEEAELLSSMKPIDITSEHMMLETETLSQCGGLNTTTELATSGAAPQMVEHIPTR